MTEAEAARAVEREAARDPDREVCGLVLRERAGGFAVLPIPNAADRWERLEPARFPGGARRGFVLDPRPLREALEAAEGRGAALHAVYHSHPDAPGEPSVRDRAEALDGEEPALPGVEWWIAPVWRGIAGRVRRYRVERGGFVERADVPGP